MKNILILNDFGYIEGGASSVAIESALDFFENNFKNVYFVYCQGPLDNRLLPYKKNCIDLNVVKVDKFSIRNIFLNLWNIKINRNLNKIFNQFDRKDLVAHVHSWIKIFSINLFYILNKNRVKTVITMHEYFWQCPNGAYYHFKKKKKCTLNPLSLECFLTNCDSRNFLYKQLRFFKIYLKNKILKFDKKFQNYIYVSNYSKKLLNQLGNIDNKSIILPNFIQKYNLKFHYNLNKKFAYVGRFSEEKGINLILEASQKLNHKITIISDLQDKRIMSRYKNINYVNWMNKKDLMSYLNKNIKCLIFSSLWHETHGLIVSEAASIGIPSIVASNTATSEFIMDNKTGLIYDCYNINDLLKKITLLEKDKLLLNELSLNSKQNFQLTYPNAKLIHKKLINYLYNLN